jgi:hypothetical protein
MFRGSLVGVWSGADDAVCVPVWWLSTGHVWRREASLFVDDLSDGWRYPDTGHEYWNEYGTVFFRK